MKINHQPKPGIPALRITLWDIINGIPAGILVFMGTVLLSTLTSLYFFLPDAGGLIILAMMSFLVGILAGITRLRQGPSTGLMTGLVAAGILGYLWLAARPGDEFNLLVIGPLGMVATIFVCPLGGWLGAKIRKVL
jgi:hypothetical protein